MVLSEELKQFSGNAKKEIRQLYEKIKQRPLTCLICITVIVTAVVLLIALPYWRITQFGITDPKDLAEMENSYRATLAQILGGIAVGIGIYFAWGNLTTAREGQITERFTRAIDQLGATDKDGKPSVEVRLGGIYALERLANESDKDYWPIMEVLTSYVRKNSPIENENINGEGIKNQNVVSFDIQAVLTIIGRRKYSLNKDEYTLNLRKTNLQGANLRLSDFNGVNLERANLSDANLQWAKIRGTNLEEADLRDADLQKCDLRESNLRGADLRGTTNLEGANLRDSDLIGAKLYRAKLIDAKLYEAKLIDANLEMASLNGAFLKGANFTRANLRKIHLRNADADLKETKFKWAHFEDAQLPWANLSGANLRMTHFEEANLIGVNLEEADLQAASLEGAYLQGAKLKGAKNLTVDQLSKVKTLYKAELDPELEKPLREKYPALFEKPKDEP